MIGVKRGFLAAHDSLLSTRSDENLQTKVLEHKRLESDQHLDFELSFNAGDTDLLIPKDDPKKIPNKMQKKNPLASEEERGKEERNYLNSKLTRYLKNAAIKLQNGFDARNGGS